MTFTPSVPVYSAERNHRKITSLNDFTGLITAWEGDLKTNYHIVKNAEADGKPESYSQAHVGVDLNSREFIDFTVKSPYSAVFSNILSGINTDYMERKYDDGYSAIDDPDSIKWSVALVGLLDPAQGVDKQFRFVIKNEKCVLSGFKNLDTLDAVQSWCLDQTPLNIEPNGA